MLYLRCYLLLMLPVISPLTAVNTKVFRMQSQLAVRGHLGAVVLEALEY
ncbi:hypothetical protein KTO58_15375 [Chitinophaga pendula]|nr:MULTISPECIES: hypothetical protein [Chitinophaga]UCJ05077.1 hypothetical protein KTO58_15375 [Chitinophaga pendula]